MRIFVSGISGFIGRHLAAELCARGDEVCGFSSDPVAPLSGARVFEHDLLDTAGVARLIERCDPEVVVHLAGLSHVGESWKRPGDYYRVNFEGTAALLRAAAGRRLVFASSAEVYGCVPEDEQPLGEDRVLDPRSPYALTKACAERLALDFGAVVVRSFNAVGPGQSRHFALPSFAAQLAAVRRREREAVLRVGDLSPRRDFVHVADVVDAYRTLAERGEAGTVYNLASGVGTSIAEALDRLLRISGVKARVERDESRIRPVDIPALVGDNRKLRALGWTPARDLDQALDELWREAVAESAAVG
jgi:GDP-4-dehydro-6-deoxy-D-mannose reductase